MSEPMTMFLLPKEHSNAARRCGNEPQETTVTTGRKYYTDSFGHKFPVGESKKDENGNTYYEEYDAVYGGEYLLFLTEDAARRHAMRREALTKLLHSNGKLNGCSLDRVSAIQNILNSQHEIVYAATVEKAYDKLLTLYRENEVCLAEFLDAVQLEGLSIVNQVFVYARLMKTVENDEVIQMREGERWELYMEPHV